MRVLRLSRGGLAVALVAMSAGLALAAPDPAFTTCTKEPSASDIEGAKGAHNAATQFFDRADYDRAIQYWKDAYSFDCTHPKTLINIGSAQEKKGDRAAAIATYEAYLVRAPNSPESSNIAEKVKNLKASLQPQPAAPSATPSAPPPPAGSATPAASASSSAGPANPPPTDAEGKRPFGVIPLVVAGAGGVAAIIGVILMPVGLGQVSDAEKVCNGPNHQCPAPSGTTTQAQIDQAKSDGNSGRGKAAAGTGLLVGGLVVAGGGLAWQFLGNSPKASAPTTGREAGARSVSFTPAVGPGIAGGFLSGRF